MENVENSATIAGRDASHFDVVIIGGALSGAATAILLLTEMPTLRVLIVEKSVVFSRRVGEATVEVSTYFLMRVLGLTQHLNERHTNKNGLRFWFTNERDSKIDDCSEIGGKYLSRVPAYLVDRAILDEEVLRRATELGASLLRPAAVQKVGLVSGGNQSVTVKHGDDVKNFSARWVVDASGVAAVLARSNQWLEPNAEHPTTALWSRWKNVKSFDDARLAKKFPAWARHCFGARGTATNHLMGDGWWAWWIPLSGGDVSIGVTFDQRLVDFPQEGLIGERLKSFLMRHPVAAELMAEAQWVDGDVHWRKNLPYTSRKFAGNGFVIVGDAGAFLDPFYSPGMDWITFTSVRARELILSQYKGDAVNELVDRHNRDLSLSYRRWFGALYRDKYQYFGDYELMKTVFLLDLGFYYLGIAAQPFKRGDVALQELPFSTAVSTPFYWFMRTYNRRFAKMARSRRKRGVLGQRNAGERFMFGGYTFSPGSFIPIAKSVAKWIFLEATEGWRTWFRKFPAEAPANSMELVPETSRS